MSSLRESMRIAARDFDKSRWSQLVEVLRLALGPGHLTAREYYYYRLFDDARFSFADKQKFIGRTSQEQIKKLVIDSRWKTLADDKYIFATIMQSQRLPTPRILATYNYKPNIRAGVIPSFHTADDLKSFLRNGVEYPLFAKPVAGSYGSGCIAIEGVNPKTDQFSLANGEELPIDQFMAILHLFPDGYLLQERLRPHPVIEEVCGNRLKTVRMVVLLDSCGARIVRACCKIPAGKNMTNNWSHGQSGNLGAAVAIEDGRLERVYRGVGVDQTTCDRHPDTGKQIQGFILPCWQDAKDLCMEAATLFPGFRLQSWDIAICDKGPVLQEMQGGDFESPQMAPQRGMLDNDFRRFLASINKHWRREIDLSILDQIPRQVYRRRYAKQSA